LVAIYTFVLADTLTQVRYTGPVYRSDTFIFTCSIGCSYLSSSHLPEKRNK